MLFEEHKYRIYVYRDFDTQDFVGYKYLIVINVEDVGPILCTSLLTYSDFGDAWKWCVTEFNRLSKPIPDE